MERISNATRNKTPPESKRLGEATPKVDMSKEIQWVATQKEKVEALKKSAMKIGEAMYKNADGGGGGGEQQSTGETGGAEEKKEEEKK